MESLQLGRKLKRSLANCKISKELLLSSIPSESLKTLRKIGRSKLETLYQESGYVPIKLKKEDKAEHMSGASCTMLSVIPFTLLEAGSMG